jgi:hypothetical protein
MQGMRPGDTIKDEVWAKVRDGLVAVTPVGELRDQVTTWLDNLRANHSDATATRFAIEVRTYVS